MPYITIHIPDDRIPAINKSAMAYDETIEQFIVTALEERMERIESVKPSRPWYQTEEVRAAIKKLRESLKEPAE